MDPRKCEDEGAVREQKEELPDEGREEEGPGGQNGTRALIESGPDGPGRRRARRAPGRVSMKMIAGLAGERSATSIGSRHPEPAPSMPFTAKDFQDLLVLLQRHPEWRAQLWAALAREELLRL